MNAFDITTNTDFRSNNVKKDEHNYIKELLNSDELYEFACKILFLIIQHSKKIGVLQDNVINILQTYSNNNIIIKLGYNKKEALHLYKIHSLKEFIEWNREENNSFLQIMSAFYVFQRDNTFVKLCIDHDSKLRNEFMNTIYKYFKLPKSLGYLEFTKTIVEKSYGIWFYLWVITFLQNPKINLIHHHADADPDYIRRWASEIEFGKNVSKNLLLHKLTRKNIKYDQLAHYKKKTIVLGKTYMRPRINGIWFNIMKKYKKEIIAGPSSSCILGYQIIFDISKILPKTIENKKKLLLCMITDYSTYYHSLSEVLQTYVSEAELPKYTLEMNDIEYLKKL